MPLNVAMSISWSVLLIVMSVSAFVIGIGLSIVGVPFCVLLPHIFRLSSGSDALSVNVIAEPLAESITVPSPLSPLSPF